MQGTGCDSNRVWPFMILVQYVQLEDVIVAGLVEPCKILFMVTLQGLLQLPLYFYKLIFLLWKDFQEKLPVTKSEFSGYKCGKLVCDARSCTFSLYGFDYCFFKTIVLIKTYSF